MKIANIYTVNLEHNAWVEDEVYKAMKGFFCVGE